MISKNKLFIINFLIFPFLVLVLETQTSRNLKERFKETESILFSTAPSQKTGKEVFQKIENTYDKEESPYKNKHFLWKVSSVTTTAYILGSLHLARYDLYPLPEEIERAFVASEVLVVEINLNEIDLLEAQRKLMEKGVYSHGERLKNHISSKTYNLLKRKLEALGLDINYLDIYKPWFLAMHLVKLELIKLGFDPRYGIDNYFLKKAKETKEIKSLETLDYQISLFDNLSAKYQELFLLSTLVELDILEREIEEMLEAWKKGDANTIEKIIFRSLKEYPEILPLHQRIFQERNKKMVAKIEEFLTTKKIHFIIVGAGHLVGKEGIIELLKKKGYSLNQL